VRNTPMQRTAALQRRVRSADQQSHGQALFASPAAAAHAACLFDCGDNWVFEIKKGRKEKQAQAKVSYPRVAQRIGPNPEQYPRFG
jgi:hypothetical protein